MPSASSPARLLTPARAWLRCSARHTLPPPQGRQQGLQGQDHREGHRLPHLRVCQQVGGRSPDLSPAQTEHLTWVGCTRGCMPSFHIQAVTKHAQRASRGMDRATAHRGSDCNQLPVNSRACCAVGQPRGPRCRVAWCGRGCQRCAVLQRDRQRPLPQKRTPPSSRKAMWSSCALPPTSCRC